MFHPIRSGIVATFKKGPSRQVFGIEISGTCTSGVVCDNGTFARAETIAGFRALREYVPSTEINEEDVHGWALSKWTG
ncbi:MAG: hypothetical protein HQL78_12765 [Magnetococcales bacterium]|nr:hypothetical protein [Magnetococcales bacterium]